MEIPVLHLNERMIQIIADRERSHHKQFWAAEKRVLKSVASVEKAATNLREAVGRAWGTLSTAAEQHGVRLSEQVLEACRSFPDDSTGRSYEELSKFQEESVQTVRTIARAYNKYIPSVIKRVKSEASVLENSISALTRSVTELGEALDASSLKELEFIASDADRLVQSAHELGLKIDEIQEVEEIAKGLHDREVKLQADLSLLRGDQTFKELNQIEQQTEQREAEILGLLEPLLKPLRKLDRADGKALHGSSKAVISRVLENPLAAVLETPTSETRELFVSVCQMLEHGELFLDQRRKRKAAEAIEVLQAGALDRFREDHGILQANRQEILRQLKGSGVYDRWLFIRKQYDDLRAETDQCQRRMIELQSQEARLRRAILAEKERMESALEKSLHEHVTIII